MFEGNDTAISPSLAEQLEAAIPQIFTQPPQKEQTPILTQEVKDYEYRNFTVSLSVANVNLPLGLLQLGIVADSLTIIQADSAFTYTMNNTKNDATAASVGQKEDQMEIREVYINNAALSGNAVIRVVWNPRLIRVR